MSRERNVTPTLMSVQKIWDQAPHSGMTDLIRYKNNWFCSFREGEQHVLGAHGTVRILTSSDSLVWTTAAVFFQTEIDLRDPKLSITPSGQLMLVCGGTIYDEDNMYASLQSRVSFSDDGKHWSSFQLILEPHEWLWRVTWNQGKAYGASYSRSDIKDRHKEWNIRLWDSFDGVKWNLTTQWDIPGNPNETTLRFTKSHTMIALVRREKRGDNHAWLGFSRPPYKQWQWNPLNFPIGGPNFVLGPEEILWVGGRLLTNTAYGQLEKTFIGTMDLSEVQRLLVLPSNGDCSYPGLAFHEDTLWVSYYSSHEEKTAIYLARVAL